MIARITASLFAPLGLAITALAAPQVTAATSGEPLITAQGRSFNSWDEYVSSPLFQSGGLRCGIPERAVRNTDPALLRVPGDCTINSTNPIAAYAPVFVYDIPVVVHVIEHNNGSGKITDQKVRTQINILNEDFRAKASSNGAGGTDAMIQFHLATLDPNGMPTNGITRSVNNTWFLDGGQYYNTLAWDTNRYLNIYTNNASGALGYVPNLPQGGIVGSKQDRVVVLWSSFGRNAPIGPPFNLGRTTTHEVGHYFGLEHTFTGGCAPAGNCYANGDLLCDTNAESRPTTGCPGAKSSCGNGDPIDNYMDYSDDDCMERFTLEQARRMRCTIDAWRPALASILPTAIVRNGNGTNPASYVSLSDPAIGTNWDSSIDVVTPGALLSVVAFGFGGPSTGLSVPAGQLLILPPISRDTATGLHSVAIPNDASLLGVTFYTQGATFSPGQVELDNAIDITIGN